MKVKRTIRAGAVILYKGKVLLVKRKSRDKYNNWWETPGGSIKERETLEKGCRREVFEESGIKLKKIEPLFFLQHPERKKIIFVFFYSELKKEPKIKLSKENSEFFWFPLEKLPKKTIPHNKKAILKAKTEIKKAAIV